MTVRSGRSLGFAYKKFLLLKTTKFFRGQPKKTKFSYINLHSGGLQNLVPSTFNMLRTPLM